MIDLMVGLMAALMVVHWGSKAFPMVEMMAALKVVLKVDLMNGEFLSKHET
jgi:hypothetical protein